MTLMATVYRHFGLATMPWGKVQATADLQRMRLAVEATLAGHAMVAVVGERGCGKTFALWQALTDTDASLIEPLRLDRERLNIGDVLAAIVRQLSDELPRHSAEARAVQARRIIRAARQPLLVIDEAQALHPQTLRALKRLRELGVRRQRSACLPVLLIGQSDPTARVAEVGLRTEVMTLAGLSRVEVNSLLQAVLGNVLSDEVREQLAASPGSGNWLELIRRVEELLAAACAAGQSQVTVAALRRQRVLTVPAPGEVAKHLTARAATRKTAARA